MTTSHTDLVAQAYDKVDRFLRNNLDDADYADYSAALDQLADALESKGEPVMWQVRRTDGSPLAVWEDCTRDLYDETLRTGRYAGYESGPPCEVRALLVLAAPGQPEKDERKPLTDEQINEIWAEKDQPLHKSALSPFGMERIRAIERAHGIGSSTEGGGT